MLGCHSLKFNNTPTSDKPEAKTESEAVAPSKFSFRIAPYVFLSDFDVPHNQPLFRELAGMRDEIYKELQLPPGNAVIQVYLFEDHAHYQRFMQAQLPGTAGSSLLRGPAALASAAPKICSSTLSGANASNKTHAGNRRTPCCTA